jgi:hypothetical protein
MAELIGYTGHFNSAARVGTLVPFHRSCRQGAGASGPLLGSHGKELANSWQFHPKQAAQLLDGNG